MRSSRSSGHLPGPAAIPAAYPLGRRSFQRRVQPLQLPPRTRLASIDSIGSLKGRAVGVVGGVANAKIVDVLTKEYDLASAKVVFKNLALTDVRQAIQSKQVSALLVVIPLAERYLSLVRGFFQLDHKKVPALAPRRASWMNTATGSI